MSKIKVNGSIDKFLEVDRFIPESESEEMVVTKATIMNESERYLADKLFPQASALAIAVEAIQHCSASYQILPMGIDASGNRSYDVMEGTRMRFKGTYGQVLVWIGRHADFGSFCEPGCGCL